VPYCSILLDHLSKFFRIIGIKTRMNLQQCPTRSHRAHTQFRSQSLRFYLCINATQNFEIRAGAGRSNNDWSFHGRPPALELPGQKIFDRLHRIDPMFVYQCFDASRHSDCTRWKKTVTMLQRSQNT
jgi:hypothetical protein